MNAIERQAVNTPVQSAASDICLEAMVAIQKQFDDFVWQPESTGPVVLFPVHDSICIECRAEDVPVVEQICRSVMERDFMGVPLTVSFEHGPTWADVKTHTQEDKEERTMRHVGLSRAL